MIRLKLARKNEEDSNYVDVNISFKWFEAAYVMCVFDWNVAAKTPIADSLSNKLFIWCYMQFCLPTIHAKRDNVMTMNQWILQIDTGINSIALRTLIKQRPQLIDFKWIFVYFHSNLN